jgi:hypothetical protein
VKPSLLSLAAGLLAAPLAVQAQMEMLSDDALSAIHGEGIYTLKAGTLSLYSVDTADIGAYTIGPIPLSAVYGVINDRRPILVDAVKTQSLVAANTALTPVTVGLQAQFATIPVFGSSLSATFTPVEISFTASTPGSI